MTNRLAQLTSSFPAALTSPARRQTFDRFELRRELGSGVTGVVWQAWDRQRTAEVALKILHRCDPALGRRFKQEFRTLADIRHRNIVRFHELFEVDERLFFSMEMIEGVDLMSWVWGYRQDDALSAAPAASIDADDEVTSPFCEDTKPTIGHFAGPKVDHDRLRDSFAQLGRGLAHLHGAGYLHRDLKPSNLMVKRDGHLMILDFGLAVSLLAPFGGDLEAAVGTIAYMAPEIAEQRTPDARADYYSFGVLLFEALTGRTPFSGDHVAAVLAAKAASEAPRPSQLVPDVPPDLDDLCHALLQRDPDKRAGAAEVARFFLDDGDEITAVTPPRIDSERSARVSGHAARAPVVGRNREVERLCADLLRVRDGGLCCRLVTGPSGIGKSTFAAELARTLTAQTPPVTVLRGRCHDREAIPFRAVDQVVDALAQHLGSLPSDERARVTPMRAHLLAELFPVLRGITPEHVRLRPRDPGVLRLAAFATLRELLRELALLRPLVLLIDDLHLADPDSLDLIAQVFLGPEPPQLLLVGLGRSGAVMDQLGRLAMTSAASFERMELGPLQGEHAEQVARALASYMDLELPDESSWASLAMDTRGHPGFTYEILRAGAASAASSSSPALLLPVPSPISASGSGDFAQHGRHRSAAISAEIATEVSAELSLPLALGSDVHSLAELGRPSAGASDSLPALASVLTTRILGLDDIGRRVIELLCAVDGPCSVQLAADLLDARVGDIAAALDELVDADLVVATGRSDDDAFELYHERIRDVAEATLGAESFADVNRTLAEALEARGDADPARLLRHWQLGGDRLRAAHYRTTLAAKAVSALELQRAALYHETSLRDELPPDLERRIRTALGEVYGFLGRQSDSANQLLAAASLTRGEPAIELRCRAAAVLLQAVEVEAGCALIEDVLDELGCAAPRSTAGSLVDRITGGITGGVTGGGTEPPGARPRRASKPTRPNSPLAGPLAAELAPSVPARLVARLRKAMPMRWRPRRGSGSWPPFQARSAESVPLRQSLMLDALATASIGVGVLQPMRGRAYQQRHLELARLVGDRVRYLRALCADAAWAACSGSSARDRVDETLAHAAASLPSPSPSRLRGELELATAISEFHLGDFSRARRAIERALAALDADSLGAQFELRQARSYASWITWITGDYATFARRTPEWAAQARDLGDRFSLTLLTSDVCIAAWLLADDVATAERQLEEAERTWTGVDAPMQRWLISSARVQLELYKGEPAAALAALEPALTAARKHGLHQVETLRVFMLHLELRTALALAAAAPRSSDGQLERALYLERATALRQHLASIPTPWAQALAALGNATCLELAGHHEPARRAYATAERALTAAALTGYAAAAAWCAAALAPALPTFASVAASVTASVSPSVTASTAQLRPATAAEDFSQAQLGQSATTAGIRDPARFFAFLVGATS